MKKVRITILGLMLAGLLFACQNKENKEQVEDVLETATVVRSKEELPKVTLNAGQLWEANPETTTGIQTLQKIISESSTDESAAVLKEKLEAEFASIFKKCTMTGEAHDQLHNYLFPLKMKINLLEESNKEAVKATISDYLNEYQQSFK